MSIVRSTDRRFLFEKTISLGLSVRNKLAFSIEVARVVLSLTYIDGNFGNVERFRTISTNLSRGSRFLDGSFFSYAYVSRVKISLPLD